MDKPPEEWSEESLQTVAGDLCLKYKKEIRDSRDQVLKSVERNIGEELKINSRFLAPLKKALTNPGMKDNAVVEQLLAIAISKEGEESEQKGVIAALDVVCKACEDGKNRYGVNHKISKQAFITGKQIAGWLLLLSLNEVWLVHNEHNIGIGGSSKINTPLTEKEYSYGEVIISRAFLQSVTFEFEKGSVVPVRGKIGAHVFECSDSAIMSEVLKPIYEDLRIDNDPPANDEEFCEEITTTIEGRFRRNKKPTYYLIKEKSYKYAIRINKFKELVVKLSGKLVFIVINSTDKSCDENCSKENIVDILDAVAEIHRLEHRLENK